jgi:hypothetical protein
MKLAHVFGCALADRSGVFRIPRQPDHVLGQHLLFGNA